MSEKVTKELILGYVGDLVADLLYYGRKEDEDLPREAIEQAIEDGKLTVDDIIDEFGTELRKCLPRD